MPFHDLNQFFVTSSLFARQDEALPAIQLPEQNDDRCQQSEYEPVYLIAVTQNDISSHFDLS